MGYGGTATEMARLINDSGVLGDKLIDLTDTKTIGLELQEVGFAKITEAIHIIQDEMGIAGATALEAGTTIEGSVNSMKAAWTNLVTGVADKNADFSKLVDDFVVSLVGDGTERNLGVFGNVLPVVEKAIGGAGKLVENLIPKLVDRVPKLLSETVPNLIKAAINTMKSVVKSIGKNAKIVVRAAKDLVLDFIDGLVDMLPDVIDAGVELLGGIVEAIPDVVVSIGKNIPKIIGAVVRGLVNGTGEVVGAIVGWFTPIDEELEKSVNRLDGYLSSIESFQDGVERAASKTVDLSKALSDSGNTISDIEGEIQKAEDAITEILRRAFKEQDGLRKEDIRKIDEYNKKIRQLNEEKLGIYKDEQIAILRRAELDKDGISIEQGKETVGEAQSALEEGKKVLNDVLNERITSIENYHKANKSIGSKAYNEELQDANDWAKKQQKILEDNYNKTIDVVADASSEWIKNEKGRWQQLGKNTKKYLEGTNIALSPLGRRIDIIGDLEKSFNSRVGIYDEAAKYYVETLGSLDVESANAFLNIQSNLIKSGEVLDRESQEAVYAILSAFGGLPDSMDEAGRSVLNSLIEGLEDKIPELKNATDMTTEEVLATLQKNLIQGSGSIKQSGYSVGENIMRGIKDGMNGFAGVVFKTTKSICESLVGIAAKTLDIRSPSRVFKNEIGKQIMAGLALGIEDYAYMADDAMGDVSNGLWSDFDDEYMTVQASGSSNGGGRSTTFGDVYITVDGANVQDARELAELVAEELQFMTERSAMANA